MPQSPGQRQEALLAQFSYQRAAIQEVIARLPEPEQARVFLGVWSARDLLAHLTGWDEANDEAVEAVRAGRMPALYSHISKDWAAFNALLVERFCVGSTEEMIAANRASHARLLEHLKALSPLDFTRDYGVRYRGYRVTIERLIQSETADEGTHLEQLLSFSQNVSKLD